MASLNYVNLFYFLVSIICRKLLSGLDARSLWLITSAQRFAAFCERHPQEWSISASQDSNFLHNAGLESLSQFLLFVGIFSITVGINVSFVPQITEL